MTLSQSLFVIGLLIAASAFFSMAEISLAAARRLRLRQMADEGDPRADRVLRMQEQPGDYFTVVQVGQNAVAILGGIVGEGALSPHFGALFALWFSEPIAEKAGFLASFLVITSLFILFADLFPKRLSMANPERLVVRLAAPMAWCMTLLQPLVWFYSRGADALFRGLGLSSLRDDRITSDDILAMMEAGARAGVLAAREQQVITNVFELDTRTISSAMSPRDRVAFFEFALALGHRPGHGEAEEFELRPGLADAVIQQIQCIRIGFAVAVLDHFEALDDRAHRLDHVVADAGSDKRGQLRVLDHSALRNRGSGQHKRFEPFGGGSKPRQLAPHGGSH